MQYFFFNETDFNVRVRWIKILIEKKKTDWHIMKFKTLTKLAIRLRSGSSSEKVSVRVKGNVPLPPPSHDEDEEEIMEALRRKNLGSPRKSDFSLSQRLLLNAHVASVENIEKVDEHSNLTPLLHAARYGDKKAGE